MNLKTAFQHQNFLTSLMTEATNKLSGYGGLLTITEQEHLRNKAVASAIDETIIVKNEDLVDYSIDDIVEFAYSLTAEKQVLTNAISETKKLSAHNIDDIIALNKIKRNMSNIFAKMLTINNTEAVRKGSGYTFNVEGNQVSYIYDIVEKKSPNFDKESVRKFQKSLLTETTTNSDLVDETMLTSSVDYTPIYDLSNSFEENILIFKSSKK